VRTLGIDNSGYRHSINFGMERSGIEAATQRAVVCAGTLKGSDRIFPTKGSVLGSSIGSEQANNVRRMALVSIKAEREVTKFSNTFHENGDIDIVSTNIELSQGEGPEINLDITLKEIPKTRNATIRTIT
jgi:hypothetical protein